MHSLLVRDFLERTSARLPGKVALVCGADRLTYLQLDEAANRLANYLLSMGLRRGDRVGICLPNSTEAVIAFFAVLKASAVAVPLNNAIKPDKLRMILNDCSARALIITSQHAAVAQSATSIPIVIQCGSSRLGSAVRSDTAEKWRDFPETQRSSAERPPRRNIDLDLACLIYTSGSTGEPKGVMSDHSNVVFASGAIIDYLGNTEQDVILNVLPLSFDYGLYQMLMSVRSGGTLVLENSFAYPSLILRRVRDERVTGLAAVPTVIALLLSFNVQAEDIATLRYITNTAAALPPAHIEQLRRAMPHVRIFSMYGLTETKRTLYLPPEWVDTKPGSVGIPIPGTEAWVEDDAGNRLEAGRIGELVVRGRHVMRGYWGDPDLSQRRFPPGAIPGERMCRTGDLFRMDADGCFYFVARKDDVIKSRGEKVAPKEVEEVLYEIPGVLEAAVFGVPDAILGHSIKAVIATDGRPLTQNQVMAHCRQRLEEYMIPKYVEFCTSLPKTASGKIRKAELQVNGGTASPESRGQLNQASLDA